MGDQLYLLEIGPGVGPLDVHNRLVESFGDRVHLSIASREAMFRDEAVRRLIEHGPSRMLGMAQRLEEALLPKGESATKLATLVNSMLLRTVEKPSELVIVDPYFFPTSKGTAPTYPDLVDQLWAGVVEHVGSIVVVAKPNPDPALFGAIEAKAKSRNPAVRVSHRGSEAFHDRFWIVDRVKGLLMGTSANGLGNRYSLADYLEDGDVREIVATLTSLGLLS